MMKKLTSASRSRTQQLITNNLRTALGESNKRLADISVSEDGIGVGEGLLGAAAAAVFVAWERWKLVLIRRKGGVMCLGRDGIGRTDCGVVSALLGDCGREGGEEGEDDGGGEHFEVGEVVEELGLLS